MNPVWERTRGKLKREMRKGYSPGKMCQRKGRKGRRREKLSCRKRRETPQIYLERELCNKLEFLKNNSS